MPVKIIDGNLLDTSARYICHQVNCKGVMGAGVAKAIRGKWPELALLHHVPNGGSRNKSEAARFKAQGWKRRSQPRKKSAGGARCSRRTGKP